MYSRTGTSGSSRGGTAAELFEFDENLKFVKLWGPGNYAASFAHAVRVDKYDNVWMVDEGSNMIVKFDPNGMVKMVLGRKPEAIDYLEKYLEHGEKGHRAHPPAGVGTFNRQTDLAWDAQDNIFVADGYNNSRVVKLGKDGSWIKTVGTRGAGPNQFNTVHGIAVDAQQGLVYVADRGNFRIQVYDTDLNFKKTITGIGAPWTVQVTAKYIYSGDGNGKLYQLDKNTGKLLGWAQTSLGRGQTGCLIHSLHARVGQRPLQGLLHAMGRGEDHDQIVRTHGSRRGPQAGLTRSGRRFDPQDRAGVLAGRHVQEPVRPLPHVANALVQLDAASARGGSPPTCR